MLFSVTFESWDDEALEAGDTDNCGFLAEGLRLRQAIQELFACGCGFVSSEVSASDSRPDCARWISVDFGRNMYTGEALQHALHLPDSISPASRARIVRLICGR